MRNDNGKYRKLFAGVDYEVDRFDGQKIVPINFDNAATTPALKIVQDNMNKSLNTYGSIGRGTGAKSIETTEIYEASRNVVLDFFNIDSSDDYTVIYVKSTTEGINLLANILISSKSEKVLTSRMEHHANDLPWRSVGDVLYVDTDSEGKLMIDDIETILQKEEIKVVTITAASNVTGYINPINKIAALAHKYGALIVVDAAQIIAHSRINIVSENKDENIDFVVFSGHKMYAPMGTGVIVGKKSLLEKAPPFLRGGGAINIVFDSEEYWGGLPQRYEAGTPNFLGVVAVMSSMLKLKEIGMENVEKYEETLKVYLYEEIKKIDGIIQYGCLDCENRLSLLSVNLKDKDHVTVARELSYLREIAVRSGCFCAHCYVKRMLGLPDQSTKKYLYDESLQRPGLVRVSLGLYNDLHEIDEFLTVLEYISKNKIIY